MDECQRSALCFASRQELLLRSTYLLLDQLHLLEPSGGSSPSSRPSPVLRALHVQRQVVSPPLPLPID
jgi:hypothetical protein